MSVGDRVRIVADENERYIGVLGVVDAIRTELFTRAGRRVAGSEFCVSVRFERPVLGLTGRWCRPQDIEVIEP